MEWGGSGKSGVRNLYVGIDGAAEGGGGGAWRSIELHGGDREILRGGSRKAVWDAAQSGGGCTGDISVCGAVRRRGVACGKWRGGGGCGASGGVYTGAGDRVFQDSADVFGGGVGDGEGGWSGAEADVAGRGRSIPVGVGEEGKGAEWGVRVCEPLWADGD